MARTLYRYAEGLAEVGDVMLKDGDHIGRLTEDQLAAEKALRAVSVEAAETRRKALFAWTDYELARQSGALLERRYLYTLEVEDGDVIFESDLQHYSEVVGSIKAGRDPDEAIRRYWANGPRCGPKPRIEVLFARGKVLKRELLPAKAEFIRQKVSGSGKVEEFDPFAD